jgi:hypothetical protein
MFTAIMNVSRENIIGQFDEMGHRKHNLSSTIVTFSHVLSLQWRTLWSYWCPCNHEAKGSMQGKTYIEHFSVILLLIWIMNVSRENIIGQFDEMGHRKIGKLQFEWQFDHIFKSYLLHVSHNLSSTIVTFSHVLSLQWRTLLSYWCPINHETKGSMQGKKGIIGLGDW